MGAEHSSQLLKGALDLCLLAVISEEPSYGYEMVRKLQLRGLALVSEGSIYPSLSRLQKQGLIEGFRVASKEGPKRKYYRIRSEGQDRLAEWSASWRELVQGVDAVLKGGAHVN